MSSPEGHDDSHLPRYPLTSSQREIWFDQMLHPNTPLYNIGGYMDIPGAVDPALFERALNLLIQRHDALRLQLLPEHDEDGVPFQTIVGTLSVSLPLHDFSAEPDPEWAAGDWMAQRFNEPFALIQSPLFHYALIRLGHTRYYCFGYGHHLIADGWATALLNRSLESIYNDLLAGRTPALDAPSYVDFIDADRRYIASPVVDAQRRFWREHYPVVPESLFSPRYHQACGHHGLAPSDATSLVMAREFYDRLEELAQRHRASRFHVLLAALYIYFTRTTGREELVIGLPVLNRANARFRQTAGLFVSTCPIRFALGTDLGVAELLQAISTDLKASYRHQRLPMSEIHRAIELEPGRQQLFELSLSYESHDYNAEFGGIRSRSVPLRRTWEQTPLMISVQEFHADAPVTFEFIYNTAYFSAWEVEALQQRFLVILEAMLATEVDSIRHLPLLSPAERVQLQAWNQTAIDFPVDGTVVDLFEAQVERTPENIAVVFEGETLSYAELNTRANQLAHALIQRGVGPEVLVGLCVERSPEMVVGLLAILKAGGAYVPLDPDYPTERLRFMIEDSAPAVLLTQARLLNALPDGVITPLMLDHEDLFSQQPTHNLPQRPGPEQLAYVIYTSGSTGQPKGAMNAHRGLSNRLLWMQDYFQLSPTEAVLQKTPFSFDVSVWEFFWPLIVGARLVLARPRCHGDPGYLSRLIDASAITTLHFVPSMLRAFLAHETLPVGGSLRRIVCSGETLDQALQNACLQRFPQVTLHNLYGPTEAAVDVTAWPCEPLDTPATVPIGRPIANTRIFILDGHRQPTPPGIPGELHIGGVQVGVGYLNRPELTAEKFIEIEIFGHTERVYRTGDLARWLPDGNLEYLGRIDHQVKLRGFRIEPGEIEAVLVQHDTVREAAVVLREGATGAALAAYVTTGERTPDPAALRDWLKTQLPDYMIPATVTVLETLPLTPNGKLDRQALPDPELTPTIGRPFRTETERLLAGLWQAVLGVAITSSDAEFFALGGHSLLATRVVSRVRETFSVEMPLAVLFDAPVLGDLASWLDQQQRGAVLPPITPQPDDEPRVLSYAQQRLWFLARLDGPSATYNMPAALRLQGTLNQPALRETFRQLLIRQRSLRLCFPEIDGAPSVVELPPYDPLVVIDLRQLDDDQQLAQVYRLADEHALIPFELENGPLFAVRLLVLDNTDQVLLLNLHHSIADGWSIGVLVRECMALYQAACQGESANLLPLPIQYTDYAAWQRAWLSGDARQRQLDYWQHTLLGAPQFLELPADHPRPVMPSYRGAHLTSCLDRDLHQVLATLARERGVTLFMTLLAAFSVLLQRYTSQGDFLIGSPIANRTQHHTEGLIGFFVNTLVLRTRPGEVITFDELLAQIRDTALGAYAHQDQPFEQLVEHLNPTRSLSHSPLFQVMLVLHNNETEPLTLPGLDIEPLARDTPIAKFDLTLDAAPTEDGLVLTWEYATDLFEAGRIQRMAAHFEVLLRGIVEHPASELHRLPLLTDAETAQLIDWNRTAVDLPHGQTVVDLFEAQVERGPDNIAVVFEGETLSYAELNTRANQLAHVLIQRGVGPEVLVGLCVERSLEMVVGLLAILKAGGAYVPLDPDYPAERLRFMVEDSGIALLLTQWALRERLPDSGVEHLLLEHTDSLTTRPGNNPPRRGRPDHLAYVIYTSGSTGKPKGVMIEHISLIEHGLAISRHYGITATDRVLQFASLSFDVAVEQILTTLISGARLVIPTNHGMDPDRFSDWLAEQVITVMDLPPAYWQTLCAVNDLAARLTTLRLLILGGDTCPPALAQHTRQHFPGLICLNAYGPTEATITTTSYPLPDATALSAMTSVPIGQALSNTRVHVLDQHRQPVPVGIPGELCIAGHRLARGYLNRPGLSAEKFIQVEVFGQTERVYRTGDLARWRPDGNLEYLGRIDQQVKLRGFRIELGEIETVLAQHETVRETAVVLHEGATDAVLAAYVTPGEGTPDPATLRDWLRSQLPDYMIPATVTVLETLPLTANGKLDRKALPAPELIPTTGRPLHTETEQLLAGLWQAVLGVEVSSGDAEFFALGGHSLLATQVVSRVRETFGVEMPLAVLFESSVLADLAVWIDRQQCGAVLPPITPQPGHEPRMLSYAQQRLWFLTRLEGRSATYNMPAALRLKGSLDRAALHETFRQLVLRHQSLRLCFPEVDGVPRVVELPLYDPLVVSDLRHLDGDQQPAEVGRVADEHALASFDLENGPLFRIRLLVLDDTEQVLLLNLHHSIADGWSIGVLVREWTALYHTACQGKAAMLPPLPIQFTDYAAWQRAWLQGEVLQHQIDYWREALAGAPQFLELPADHPRPVMPSYRGSYFTSHLDGDLHQALESLGRERGATLFMTLLAAFSVLLQRYTGQGDLLLGSPIANRTQHHTEGLIGFFVNTLVLRTRPGEVATFEQLLTQVRETALGAYAHQDLPFEQLVEHMNPTRSLSHSPLLQVMLVLQNHDTEPLTLPELDIEPLERDTPIAKFDLTLNAEPTEDGLVLTWEYATDLFEPERIQRMAAHFEVLLRRIVEHPASELHRLPLLTEAETAQLIDWNRTAVDFPQEQTMVDLFEVQVERGPDNIAVVFESEALTYSELNTRANQLAHALIGEGVGPDVLVGLCVERSLEMVVGLLAILKAGGAYVPLDPDFPPERLRFMVEDSGIALLLTQTVLGERLPDHGTDRLLLDHTDLLATQPGHNPSRRTRSASLAYVIYTSGSTGTPKGVMIHHLALTNILSSVGQSIGLNPRHRLLALTTLSFDIAALELFAPLITGASLELVPAAVTRDPTLLQARLRNERITLAQATPTTWRLLLDSDWEPTGELTILCGGEALPEALAQRLLTHGQHLWNLYGPTETTIWSTAHPASCLAQQPTLIGRPIANTRIYLLDRYHQCVPVGVPGELCIAGAGLARGYLNRPDLSAEKFIEVEVFGHTELVYRTGDLARWRPDGNLEYLGRIDQQVKLRGFRIEPGEIEAVLTRHKTVREAAVVLREGPEGAALAAYVTPGAGSPDPAALRDWLKTQLPDHMVPATITVLETLPLTPNGKLNRRALPDPELTPITGRPLRTEAEQLLAGVWQAVLGVAITSRDVEFFALGGHSLLATRVVSRVRETFGVEMPLAVLFDAPVLRDLAAWLDRQQRGTVLPPITSQPDDAPRVLSYAQQRLWFLARLEGHSATYNMPAALRLKGKLDQAALGETFRQLVSRHQSLRLCFPEVDDAPSVVELPAFDPLVVSDLRQLDPDQQRAEVARLADEHTLTPFDLDNGPLFRVRLLVLDEAEQVLLLNLHHSIADGWSIGVLVQEWTALYRAACQGEPANLSPLPIQYTDYAAWQRAWLQGEALQRQLDYWQETLAGAPQLLELPADHPRPVMSSYRGAHLSSRLDGDLHHALLHLGRERGGTLFMTLLAAFSVLLQRYTGQGHLLIGSPIANRTQHHTENLIGFFVNTLVLRARPAEVATFDELLTQIRETALGAYAHQDLPFEQLVEHLNPTRSLSHSPLFQVMFVLQNNAIEPLALPGLDIEPLARDTPIAKFDLTLNAEPTEDGLVLSWEYATDLFEVERIQRMAAHFEVLLRGIVAHPNCALHRLPLLTEAETAQLIAWNRTAVDFPLGQTVVDLFQAQVEHTPDNIAVVFEDESLSYAELNTRANQLAHVLIQRGVGPEVLVGVCVERSPEMVVGLLAILKAGGAYVPLDPDYPTERLCFMVEDSGIALLLTQSALRERLPDSGVTCLLLENTAALATQPEHNPSRRGRPDHLAYVIYTSGSTGRPKGVMIEHHSFAEHGLISVECYGITTTDRVSQFASLSFDAAAEQIFATLIRGATLVMPVDNRLDPDSLIDWLATRGVTVMHLPPAYWQTLSTVDDLATRLATLRLLRLGGDVFPPSLALQTRERLPRLTCVNTYGPTEATITTTLYTLPDAAALTAPTSVPIGRPLPNTRVYVLDQHRQPVPVGVPGELCIAGRRLARGYLNRPELTAEKFIEVEVFGHTERVYRTGDLARWLPDGNLEFLGRIDHQVKLRGFRIEPGEIEAVLVQHDTVLEAAVVLREIAAGLALAAYVTPGEGIPDPALLRDWLGSQLPDYMIPATITVLETLPLTPNGKLDRAALPSPQARTVSNAFAPPRDILEAQLLTLWQSLLEAPGLGIHDDFFAAGGHSLLAIRLMGQVREQFQVTLPVNLLFQSPTVAELAGHLRGEIATPAPRHCIPMQIVAQTQPLFLLPGAPGSALYLQPLTAALGRTRSLYALETPGLHGEPILPTVEALAEFHLHVMREIQPQGPYWLLGHSSGGQVAFEMACQLEEMGESVAWLGILDTGAPGSHQTGSLEDHPVQWLWPLVEAFQESTGVDLELSRETLEALDDTTAQARVLEAYRQREDSLDLGTTVEEIERWIQTYRSTVLANANYRSNTRLHCPIHLFRAREGLTELNHPHLLWGWEQHTRSEVRVLSVPGDHMSMMVTPQVGALAGAIRDAWPDPPDIEAAD